MIRKFKSCPQLGSRVFVDVQATVIGDVTLGDDSSIWPQTVIRGDIKPISIGERSNIQDGSVVHVTHKSDYSPGYECIIGSDVTIGMVVLFMLAQLKVYPSSVWAVQY